MSRKSSQNHKVGAALVVGGGIGGMQAALDLADAGIKAYLMDRKPSIGGVMSQLDKTFPTNDCAMCTMAPRLVEIGRRRDIEKITLAEVDQVRGDPGHFTVTVRKAPRYVDEDRCTGCAACMANCPVRFEVQPVEPAPITLAPEVRQRVDRIIAKNRDRKGPLMPILQEINSAFRYFPEEVLRYVSQETGYPLTHICRIATFYSTFSLQPVGKYIINVCMGTTCYVRGAQKLFDKLTDVLGIRVNETTPDMLFTFRAVRCVGCCGLAPVVAAGEEVFGKLQANAIPGIIRQLRNKDSRHAKTYD